MWIYQRETSEQHTPWMEHGNHGSQWTSFPHTQVPGLSAGADQHSQHKVKTYHCISFVLQPLGLFNVVFLWMVPELGRERKEKKGRTIICFTFLSRGCYGLIDFLKNRCWNNTENLSSETEKYQRLGFYGSKLIFSFPQKDSRHITYPSSSIDP